MTDVQKIVTYKCPGCKREIRRRMDVASRILESFCATAGKTMKMRRLRWTRS